MLRPIENNSQPGDAIYDPFVGSGTSIIAAEMTGRRCYAIEISPAYVDVCIRRFIAFSDGADKVSLMNEDGKKMTFAEVKDARYNENAYVEGSVQEELKAVEDMARATPAALDGHSSSAAILIDDG